MLVWAEIVWPGVPQLTQIELTIPRAPYVCIGLTYRPTRFPFKIHMERQRIAAF